VELNGPARFPYRFPPPTGRVTPRARFGARARFGSPHVDGAGVAVSTAESVVVMWLPFFTRCEVCLRRAASQGLAQRLGLPAGKQHGLLVRGMELAVVHRLRPLRVVAIGQLAAPVGAIAAALGDGFGRLPAREQPEDLPPAALVDLRSLPVAPCQHVGAEAPSKLYSSHASTYNIPTGLVIRPGGREQIRHGNAERPLHLKASVALHRGDTAR
jgi:hypothetical protein